MLRRIHLHGSLKKIHPEVIEVEADNVGEALRVVTTQLPGFKPNAIEGYKRIQVAGCRTVEDLFSETDMVDIHVFPQLNGGKSGGFIQILLGVVLIAAAFAIGAAGFLGGLLLKVGAMMLLGGILQLISAPKRDKDDKQQQKSHYLGPPQNTVEIGTSIPILYGRRKVGGHYLSFNVSAVEGSVG